MGYPFRLRWVIGLIIQDSVLFPFQRPVQPFAPSSLPARVPPSSPVGPSFRGRGRMAFFNRRRSERVGGFVHQNFDEIL